MFSLGYYNDGRSTFLQPFCDHYNNGRITFCGAGRTYYRYKKSVRPSDLAP